MTLAEAIEELTKRGCVAQAQYHLDGVLQHLVIAVRVTGTKDAYCAPLPDDESLDEAFLNHMEQEAKGGFLKR